MSFLTNFVYLAPVDRPLATDKSAVINQSILHIQSWLWVHLSTKTITPNVVTCQSDKTLDWFKNNQTTSSWRDNFWLNSISEANRLCGAGFYDPFNTWVIFTDAELLSGQYIGGTNGGGTNPSGVAVRDGPVIQGMLGNLPEERPVCLNHGGNAHELLHTYGIAHPDGDPLWNKLLMGTGYALYPNCLLTADEAFALSTNQFFSTQRGHYPPHGLCPFSMRPLPTPRPRPIPKPRPE